MKTIGAFSFGVGDRFGMQGVAQLQAFVQAQQKGRAITPVWNKSEREHGIVGTSPDDVRIEADAAVRQLGWSGAWFCDADHIHLGCVERYIRPCDFFTIDVAEKLGEGLEAAAAEAGKIYRRIAAVRGEGTFITEVSMDETARPQTADELFTMLRLLAAEKIPVQTIAPRFPGRFNKGVEYVGSPAEFGRAFEAMVQTVARGVEELGLPASLKLSLHSGSDKFAIYPIIGEILKKHGAGLHVKTAGTTWLEEVAGLAEAGGEALAMAKEIYRQAFEHRDELTAPYAQVIQVDPARLPLPEVVERWSAAEFVAALEHDSACPHYNADLRQLIHVGYKVAARLGAAYRAMILAHAEVIGARVTANLYDRHMKRLFEELA
jgi:hypothetical protein